MGRAYALVGASGDLIAKVEFDLAMKKTQGTLRSDGVNEMMLVLYKVLGSTELSAPPNVRGSFIPAGNTFDAFAALAKVLQTSTADILIVDPYMDETILTDFAGSIAPNVCVRLLSDESTARASLTPAATRWATQHGTSRQLGFRLAHPRTLHDRAIFIDGSTGWILTQSLKDFAKRSPAEIVRADDTAPLKIVAYEAIWQSARIVV